MGTITTGTGLMSGLDIQGLVDSLMQIEARPLTLVERQRSELQAERTALLGLSAQLLAVQASIAQLGESATFQQRRATSSNESVMISSAQANAALGTFTFQVQSMVSTHQMISRGFANANSTPIGAGVITMELGGGSLNATTSLDLLNGMNGVRGGTVRVTDRSGATAQIDLTTALTIDDVLETINSQTTVRVEASVEGDHLVLTDTTGLTTGNLVVQDLGSGFAARDLGIQGFSSDGRLAGKDINFLSTDSLLSSLNDGNGVRGGTTGGDFRITLRNGDTMDIELSDRLRFGTALSQLNGGHGVRLGVIRITDTAGVSAEVDLTSAQTVDDVNDLIAAQTPGMTINVSLTGGHMTITDGAGGEGAFTIEDVSGFAASDLGLAKEVEGKTIRGSDVLQMTTLNDVFVAINNATITDANGVERINGGELVARSADDGNSLVLEDMTVGAAPTVVEALNDSKAADDLGVLGRGVGGVVHGRQVLAGLNTVLLRSLNGGSGVTGKFIDIIDRNSNSASITVSGIQTVSGLIDAINSAGVGVQARVNDAGTGILIEDTSGGTGNLTIIGDAAESLGIAIDAAVAKADSGNLQLQYISESTLLEDLNGGKGVAEGRFRITDSNGARQTFTITENMTALGDVIKLINNSGIDVEASINATGDGLLLSDIGAGAGTLTVEALDGDSTVTDLGIGGTGVQVADPTTGLITQQIDGTSELRIEIDGDDTLQDVVDKITEANGLVSASIINDGSAANPYRLSLRSEVTGTVGAVVFDPGQTGLVMNTLVEAHDAVVFLGEAGGPNSVVITSSSNSLDNVIPGVTLDLVGTSSEPVTISIGEDIDSVVGSLRSFVDAFNNVVDQMDALTDYNPETNKRGVLMGDSTVETIRSQIYGMVSRSVTAATGQFKFLNQIGITVGSGAKLNFDEADFRDAFASDPDDVSALFTVDETGLAAVFESVLKRLTDTRDGTLAQRDEAMQNLDDLLGDRIASLTEKLGRKEQRLLSQFYAMETALAQLQGQQNALAGLISLASSVKTKAAG